MKTKIRWGTFTGFVLAGLLALLLTSFTFIHRNTSHSTDGTLTKPSATAGAATKWNGGYAHLPIGFEENRGQAAHDVRFVAHGAGYGLAFAPQEADITLIRRKAMSASPIYRATYLRQLRAASKAHQTTAIRMQLEGANPSAKIAGADKLPGRTNYFVGNDSRNWVTDVPSYARVKYTEIYPGVDLLFYGNQRRLEYDFIVAPGADPKAIKFKVDGAQRLALNSSGDLILNVPDGAVEFKKPVIYQMAGDERREIAGNFALGSDNRVSFSIAKYDASLPLVIDPLLSYSTYLGGSSDETGFGIAVDAAGDAFVAGSTTSPTDFPVTAHPFQSASGVGPGLCGFVTEIDPTGASQVYSSYICGSSGFDQAFAVAVDGGGNVYVAGETASPDFPPMNGLTAPTTIPANGSAGFVAKFNPLATTGAASLLYTSYVGGTVFDVANAIVVDGAGNAYIGGLTSSGPGVPGSGGFPVTAGAFQPAPDPLNTVGTGFLARIDTTVTGNAGLIYATYLGGNAANQANFLGFGEQVSGVAVDSANIAYVTGVTSSTNFPSFNGIPGTPIAANTSAAAFVSRIDTTKTVQAPLTYSTYLEGSTSDAGSAIALGPNNVAYVTGVTDSTTGFPITAGAFQTKGNVNGVAFITLIDTTLSGLPAVKYSTFFGGTNGNTGFGIQADSLGVAYVVGTTASTDFPITPGVLPTSPPNLNGDPFVVKLNPVGGGASDRIYASYFGGSGDGSSDADQGFAIAIDSNNNAYITGVTFDALDLPATNGAFQTSLNGTSDAFVAKLPLVLPVVVAPTSLDFGTQLVGAVTNPQTVTLTNNNPGPLTINSVAIVATAPPAAGTDFKILSNTCGASVAAGASCTVMVTFTPSVAAAESAKLNFNDNDPSTPQTVTLTGTGVANGSVVTLTPPSLTFAGQLVTTPSTTNPTVTIKNTGNATLNIDSVAFSGDFSQQATTCSDTLTAGSSCVVTVTFTPTATGKRTGAITITDDATNGSPQTVPLTGTGTDFTITAPPSVTVPRHSTQMFNVTVTPISGFNQAVALTCSGAPARTTCSVASPVTPDGVNPINSPVTIVSMSSLPATPTRIPPPSGRQMVLIAMALALLAMVFATKRLRTRLGLAGAMLVLCAVAGCGGGHKPVTATLTLTGTVGTVAHSTNVALTVD